ncbi:hypothetical protein BJ138DRAFT_407788 [Hygrophoropsis aurantiaca]|uniref:Uncharacterized protein n=1 Tax=Hygrophoropsis aurantiaca TaxID=72124 RepID=A0ACB8A4A9_9AGAM|nr:hypothetical protein BJ138DRAFT_407788 [Hygrophoropsis aurantiaca]
MGVERAAPPEDLGNDYSEQDFTITKEAHSEQVVPSTSQPRHSASISAADEVGTSSSAQASQSPSFASYDSPFAVYPLLRSVSQLGSSSFSQGSSYSSHSVLVPSVPTSSDHPLTYHTPSSSSSHLSSLSVSLPDLKPLKQAVLQRSLGQLTADDTGRRVCQYEVPGGGVCRDRDCTDLHLSRIASEPNDSEIAAYVHGALPHPWYGRCDVRAIEIALEGVRLRGGSTKDIDGRVREALVGLGIPVAT